MKDGLNISQMLRLVERLRVMAADELRDRWDWGGRTSRVEGCKVGAM